MLNKLQTKYATVTQLIASLRVFPIQNLFCGILAVNTTIIVYIGFI
jgi:hypothetical protein